MTLQIKDEFQQNNYPDLLTMCRLCLKENAGEIDIFESENSLVLRILTCTAIEIKSSDPLSKFICEKCRIDLERSYYFRKRSQNNNNKLKKHLRLINAGKKSTIFDKNSENDDDEFEFEDSLFLKNIDEKEKQNRENEILQKIENIMKQREQEFYKRENELIEKHELELARKSKELSERIIVLKYEQKTKKEQYKRLMNKRYKTLTENCRKKESERILCEIREYINSNIATKIETNKRKSIPNKKNNQIPTKRQKCKFISPTKIKMKSETTTTTTREETNSVEIFDIDSQPPERLTCNDAAVNENSELEIETTTIDDNDEHNDEKIQNPLTDTTNDFQENPHDESIEIIAYDDEELSEYDDDMQTGEYLRFNDNLKNNKLNAIEEKDEEELQDCDDNDEESNTTNIIDDDENSFQFEQTTESNKAVVSYLSDDKVDESVNMEKISDQVTKYQLTTPEGDIIYMSLESPDDNSTTINTKQNVKNVTDGSDIITTTTTTTNNTNINNDFDKIVDDMLSDDTKIKPSAVYDTVRIFRCKLCPQAFSREALLLRHVVVHDKTRQYDCEYCDKWFACRSSLNRHIRVHTGEKPFKCDQCERTFIQKEILKRHMLTHTGEKPYKCPHCDKSFAQKPILRSHINQNHTKNPVREQHECHLCPKTFKHASGLSRHLISHTGIFFKCKECGRSFKDKSAMKRHLLSIHGKDHKKSE